MGLHIIKPASVFMVESHPPFPVCTHSSFLRPARHRAIKFGNSIPPCRTRLHVHMHIRIYPPPPNHHHACDRRAHIPALGASFCRRVERRVRARLRPTAFYKRIKVNGGGAPRAIPHKAHPDRFSSSSVPACPRPYARTFAERSPALFHLHFSAPLPSGCRCQDRIFVYNPRRISVLRTTWNITLRPPADCAHLEPTDV